MAGVEEKMDVWIVKVRAWMTDEDGNVAGEETGGNCSLL